MFGLLEGKRTTYVYTASNDRARDEVTWPGPDRHRRALSCVIWGSPYVVKRASLPFVAGMGVRRVFLADNGTEYSNDISVYHCNRFGIRRELHLTSRAFKARHAVHLGVPRLNLDVRREETWGFTHTAWTILWLELLLWTSKSFNRVATPVSDECPPLHMLAFQPAYYRVPRKRNIYPRARMCYCLNVGTITGGTVLNCWTRKRGGSYTCATPLDNTQRRRRSWLC